MFEAPTAESAEGDSLPRIPLFAHSRIVEMVLPLMYRGSPTALRTMPYADLVAALKLAHRLGLPMAVSCLAMFLEAQ